MTYFDFIYDSSNNPLHCVILDSQNKIEHIQIQKFNRVLNEKIELVREKLSKLGCDGPIVSSDAQHLVGIFGASLFRNIDLIDIKYLVYLIVKLSKEELNNSSFYIDILIYKGNKLTKSKIQIIQQVENIRKTRIIQNDNCIPNFLRAKFLEQRVNLMKQVYESFNIEKRNLAENYYKSVIKPTIIPIKELSQTLKFKQADIEFQKKNADSLHKTKILQAIIDTNYKTKTQYNEYATETGRLISNVSNLPKYVRKIIQPNNDFIYELDYHAIDFIVASNLAGYYFNVNFDIYNHIQQMVEKDELGMSSRDIVKQYVFNILYSAKYSKESEIISSGKLPFNKIEKLKTSLFHEFNKNGYVLNPFGRIIMPNIKDEDRGMKSLVFSHYIQSTSNDIMLQAMSKVSEYIQRKTLLTKAIMYNYDSLLFDAKESELNEVVPLMNCMKCEKFPDLRLNCSIVSTS